MAIYNSDFSLCLTSHKIKFPYFEKLCQAKAFRRANSSLHAVEKAIKEGNTLKALENSGGKN